MGISLFALVRPFEGEHLLDIFGCRLWTVGMGGTFDHGLLLVVYSRSGMMKVTSILPMRRGVGAHGLGDFDFRFRPRLRTSP